MYYYYADRVRAFNFRISRTSYFIVCKTGLPTHFHRCCLSICLFSCVLGCVQGWSDNAFILGLVLCGLVLVSGLYGGWSCWCVY